jgi:hypothetical protein
MEKGETISLTDLKPKDEFVKEKKEKKVVDIENVKKVLEEILKKNEENR